MPSSTSRSVRPSMPSACEVTVALDARVGRAERLERPAAVGELHPEHAARPGPARPPACRPARRRSVTASALLRGATTVSRARSARPAPMRNESRKARVAARSSWASRSRSSWAAAGRSSGARSSRREGAVQVGDLALLLGQLVAERLGDRDLVLRLQRGVEHQGGDRLLGRHLGVLQVGGEDRRQDRQPHDHADVAGADGPPGVLDPRQPHLHRLGGEPVDGQPEPEADQRLGRDRPGEVGRRRDREADQPAGDEEAAHRDLDLGPGAAGGGRAGGRRAPRPARRTRSAPRSPGSGASPRPGAGPAGTAPP